MLFLCGHGPAAERILIAEHRRKTRVGVFTHDLNGGLALLARELGCYVTTANVNDVDEWPGIPALIASICYLHIIKPPLIEQMAGRIINCHAALLPRHRGRSAVAWAIADGDQQTGITYHYIDAGIDTGNIILQAACDIAPDETQDTLFPKMYRMMVDYWYPARHLANINWPGVAQPEGGYYHHAGPPYDGLIRETWEPERVERFIRAMTLQGKPYARYRGQEVVTFADYERLRKDGA